MESAFAMVPQRAGETHMAKAPKTLDVLFHDTLKDIYFAEKDNSEDASEAGQSCAQRCAQSCCSKDTTARRKDTSSVSNRCSP